MMGHGDAEAATEAVEATEVALITDERLWCPRVGGINHPHALEHHERSEGATRGWVGPNICADSAEFTNKWVAQEGLGKEEAAGEVSVPGAERRPDPNAATVVEHPTGRVPGAVKMEASIVEEATPSDVMATGTITTHAYGQPAEQPMPVGGGRKAGPPGGRDVGQGTCGEEVGRK